MEPIKNEQEVKQSLRLMESAAVNFAYRFINDSRVRQAYIASTKSMSDELVKAYKLGDLTPKEAAQAANEMRNQIMEFARVRSSDLGRAKAKSLKLRGLDLDQLTNKYAGKLFKKTMSELADSDKNKVYLAIVESAGRSRPSVSAKAARLGTVGKAFWAFTACIAIYNISTADNKVKRAGREASSIGGGVSGGAAGGGVAGIWCGPLGIAIGAIIGGILGSIAAEQVYIEIAGPDGDFARNFLPRFTSAININEEGIANALIKECTYDLDKVYAIFYQLDDKYSTDADDVARIYIDKIKALPPSPTKEVFALHGKLRNFLIYLLESGWTSVKERNQIQYLKGFS